MRSHPHQTESDRVQAIALKNLSLFALAGVCTCPTLSKIAA
ncbi:hypothetical protein [Coleofasciculus sp. FACHB-SPT36]|nr:hypothetical protein [Coleofasciculus sp. FACHB-SPT36]